MEYKKIDHISLQCAWHTWSWLDRTDGTKECRPSEHVPEYIPIAKVSYRRLEIMIVFWHFSRTLLITQKNIYFIYSILIAHDSTSTRIEISCTSQDSYPLFHHGVRSVFLYKSIFVMIGSLRKCSLSQADSGKMDFQEWQTSSNISGCVIKP